MKSPLFFSPIQPYLSKKASTQYANNLLEEKPSRVLRIHISFDQDTLCDEIKKNNYRYETLYSIYQNYDGLCDLICNYMIINKLLDNPSRINCLNAINAINVAELNKPEIKSSHIIENSSLFSICNAYLFHDYPYALFPADEVLEDNEINDRLLSSKLNEINEGEYIKFYVFGSNLLSFKGHSMLIKKTGCDYLFFDPNQGIDLHLSLVALCNKLNNAYTQYHGTAIAFISGNEYIANLQREELESAFSVPLFSLFA